MNNPVRVLDDSRLSIADYTESVRLLLNKKELSNEELLEVSKLIDKEPLVLNKLSLEDFSKLSDLGIDLSGYMNQVQANNIRSFLFKYVVQSMTRVSRLVATLEKIEEKYYSSVESKEELYGREAISVITTIQSSIQSSITIMNSLTSNDALMNFMYVEMNQINQSINYDINNNDSPKLGVESRKRLVKLATTLNEALDGEKDGIKESVIDID